MSDASMSTEDINFLFALRTRTLRGIRKDFEGMYQNVLCPLCQTHEDTIPNLLLCEELRAVPRNGAMAPHMKIFLANMLTLKGQLSSNSEH